MATDDELIERVVADLDPDQRAAVTTPSHLVAVIAGAGSGKTRVLTRRAAFRVATGDADPQHTLVLTFTREAAGELRRRLARAGLRDHVEAGTFHSVFLSVLRQRWADTDRPAKTVVPDRRRLLREALDDDRRAPHGARRGTARAADRAAFEAAIDEIGWARALGLGPEQYAGRARQAGRRPVGGVDRVAEAFAAYERVKRTRGVVDFDDVLLHVLRDAHHDASFAAVLRWRFRHLLVDEAQDLNPVQHRLLDVLRDGRDDLFLVGDPAQAIYGFNGADPSLLVDVERRFPGVEIVRLPINHRCTPQIVRAGLHVLDAGGQPADLRSARGDGSSIATLVGDDERDEAVLAARLIVRGNADLIRSGNVAVLARTHAQLGVFETALAELGLPVRRRRADTASPLAAALRYAGSLSSANALRGWAHDTLDDTDALESARARRDQAAASMPTSNPSRAQRTALADLDRVVELVESERRVASVLLDYLRNQPRGDGAGFRSWVATTDPFRDGTDDGVELLTFHASKGREWHTVVVSGTETSLVPHRSATTAASRAEEARLLYVAFTRATDRLVVSRAQRRGGYERKPSPFVEHLDTTGPAAVPPPRSLRTGERRPPADAVLRAWRDEAARRADVLPTQLCSDRDLQAIVAVRPTTADELAAATSMGILTARRLAPEILPLVAR